MAHIYHKRFGSYRIIKGEIKIMSSIITEIICLDLIQNTNFKLLHLSGMINETMAVIYYTMYYFVLIHQKVHIAINLYILHSILFIHFIF